jgi:hypothetical protein
LRFGHADTFEIWQNAEFCAAWLLSVYAFDDEHLLILIDFTQLYFNNFAAAGLHGSSYEGSLNGKFAMPAIDQSKQLYAAWAPMIEKRIECSPDGAARVEHIIDKNDISPIYIETQIAGAEDRANIFRREVIPIKTDVQHANIDRMFLDPVDQGGQSLGQGNAASLYANKAEVFSAIVLLDNLVGKPDECPLNL